MIPGSASNWKNLFYFAGDLVNPIGFTSDLNIIGEEISNIYIALFKYHLSTSPTSLIYVPKYQITVIDTLPLSSKWITSVDDEQAFWSGRIWSSQENYTTTKEKQCLTHMHRWLVLNVKGNIVFPYTIKTELSGFVVTLHMGTCKQCPMPRPSASGQSWPVHTCPRALWQQNPPMTGLYSLNNKLKGDLGRALIDKPVSPTLSKAPG